MSRQLDDLILNALLSEPSVTAAARVAGCGRDAVYARLHDPAFLKRLNAALDERRAAINAQSVATLERACESLRDVLEHPIGTNTRDKLRAVEIALRYLKRDE